MSRTPAGVALAGHEGTVVRLRASQAIHNSPLLSMAELLTRSQLETGRPRATDSDQANDAMREWSMSCGYRHQAGSLGQVLGSAIYEAYESGAAFIRRVQRKPSAYSPNGLLLQGLRWRDIATERGELGFEYADDQLVGVWFRVQSDLPGLQIFDGRATLVDMRDLAMLRLRLNFDQLDGLPRTAPALADDHFGASLQLAEMQSATTKSALTAVVTAPQSPYGKIMQSSLEVTTAASGHPTESLAPGTILFAKGGEKVHFSPVGSNQINHTNSAARVAAGVGHTLQAIGGDTATASFSSLAWAAMMSNLTSERFGRDIGLAETRAKIIEWFLLAELGVGRNHLGVKWEWPPPRSLTANKAQHASALSTLVGPNAGPIISMAQARADLGVDPDATADMIADEQVAMQQPTPQGAEREAA